jgi:hypothetical protein
MMLDSLICMEISGVMRPKMCSTAEQAQLSGIVEAEHDADNPDGTRQSCN